MAGTTGLEPATSAVTGQRSNQLSYVPRCNLVFRKETLKQESRIWATILFGVLTFPVTSEPRQARCDFALSP
jgi:hypothetical protein